MASARPSRYGNLLKRYRTAAGLTQEELSERAGLSARGVQDLERGLRRSPHPDTTRRLAEALGLGEAERVDLVSAAGTASSDGAAVASPVMRGLPTPLTSFVGRERELVEIQRLLTSTRLLTLTGIGGVGKTRLALRVAADLVGEYPDGVWFADVAPLTDPTLVPEAVATALGVHEVPSRPLLATLTDYVRSRAILVILDNCEHLLDACARLADALLQSCPRLQLLTTSRERLGIAGEMTWRVPSLSRPDPRNPLNVASLTECEAAQLFIDRAARQGFEVTDQNARAVAQICWRLDGIPLALELAAARVSVLTVEQSASRLDHRFRLLTGGSRTALRRQRTLEATIDWSYNLLSDCERVFLRRLSVFAAGWTLEAAEAVGVAEGIAASEVLDLLAALVDKSLVVAEGEGEHKRYRMLETIRLYAKEKLVGAGEAAAAQACHRDWYLDLAEQALPEMERHDQKRWLDWLEDEHDNLRAALAWSLACPADAPILLRLAAALGMFWRLHGYNREAIGWLDTALARSESAPSVDRARALDWLGHFAWIEGNVERARTLLVESVAQARIVGDGKVLAQAMRHLSYAVKSLGDRAEARRLLEEGVAVGRAVGDQRAIAYSLHDLAALFVHEDALEAIEPRLIESLAIARECGDAITLCEALFGLTWVHNRRGDLARARDTLDECLALARQTGVRWPIMFALLGFGDLAATDKDLDGAIAWYRQALPMVVDVERSLTAYALGRYAAVCAARGDYRRAVRIFAAASNTPGSKRQQTFSCPTVQAERWRRMWQLHDWRSAKPSSLRYGPRAKR